MSITFKPRPYQGLLLDHFHRTPRCNGWAGMGLGKTVSALTAVSEWQDLGVDAGPVLVVAPLRVAQSTWPDEQRKWNHLRDVPVQFVGGTRQQRIKAVLENAPVHTINLEQVPWLVDQFGKAWPYRTIIVDESTRLKGFRLRQGTERAKALARVAHTSKVARWINLTGTPASNGLTDLWGPQWYIDRGSRLGLTFKAFRDRWFHYDPLRYITRALPHAMDEITSLLRDCTLTLEAKDWFDLKAPIVHQVLVDLPDKARSHYDDMFRLFVTAISSTVVDAKTAADKSIKCLQLANGAVFTDNGAYIETHSAKLDALESIVNEAGGPVLVAYQFTHDRERILKAFRQARVLDDDPQTITDWNAGKIPILLAHPKSAGHGLNLQHGGNVLAFFGHWWDLELRDQMVERIGPTRQLQSGYDRPVFIYDIVARDTVDLLVLAKHATKRSIQDVVLDSVKQSKRN
ncbi:DEXDc domain containing protein [uncultured Caudovirales phage]|uniref:DEXDc domain containing protein n=1 Tax=uncultured Caudovirales phage TaxID=2100421 RepID=A0A6J5NZM5_9CAUD|nr:DEXDc domain containing protein [uncultured Caudovirales phage]